MGKTAKTFLFGLILERVVAYGLLAGCCAYARQPWCAVRFSIFLHLIFIGLLIFVQNPSPLHKAAEYAHFPNVDHVPEGVAGTVATLVTPPLGVAPEQKSELSVCGWITALHIGLLGESKVFTP